MKRSIDKTYRDANKSRHKVNAADWYRKNREKTIQRSKEHAAENPESARKRRKKWKQSNPESVIYDAAIRRARKRNAIPSWYGEFDELVIQEAAILCRQRRLQTGFDWHIDHMVPLAAKKASGLHCGLNCQVIPNYMNIQKNNKLILTQPGEWIRNLQ